MKTFGACMAVKRDGKRNLYLKPVPRSQNQKSIQLRWINPSSVLSNSRFNTSRSLFYPSTVLKKERTLSSHGVCDRVTSSGDEIEGITQDRCLCLCYKARITIIKNQTSIEVNFNHWITWRRPFNNCSRRMCRKSGVEKMKL
ncbi:hypothetical protein GQ457_09G013630 [Hibiscus cannabinus]